MRKLNLAPWSVVVLGAVVLGTAVSFLAGLVPKPATGSFSDQTVTLPDFTLKDQSGQSFTFSKTRGKVVVMAFLFTHCGDVCPFSAIKLRLAREQLGEQAKNVEVVVIDTDPERDTVPVLADYSKELGLFDKWHMVTGDLPVMQKLYQALRITVVKTSEEETPSPSPKDESTSPLSGLNQAQIADGGKVAKKFMGGYQIAHSAPFWVIDSDGTLRTSLAVSASPDQIVTAVKHYLKS